MLYKKESQVTSNPLEKDSVPSKKWWLESYLSAFTSCFLFFYNLFQTAVSVAATSNRDRVCLEQQSVCNDVMFILFLQSHQCIVVAEQCKPVSAVLLCRHVAALLFIDGVSFSLAQAEEPADHAQILPQGPVLWVGILPPTQQLTQPALYSRDGNTLLRVPWPTIYKQYINI